MTIYRGVHEKLVAVGMEGTYGIVGTYRSLIPCEFKADYKRDSVIKPLVGPARLDAYAYKREGVLSGNFAMSAVTSDIGEVLKCFFGTNTTVGAGGTYLHTFTPVGTLASTFPSMSAKVNFGQTTVYDYTGIRIDKLTISANAKEDVKISADFIGHDEVVGTACPVTVVYGTGMPLVFSQITYTLDGTVQTPRNFTFEANNSLSDGFRVGADYNTVNPLPSKEMTATVKFDIDFVSSDERNKYLAGSYMPLTIFVQGETFSGTTKQELTLTMPRITYASAPFETFDGLLGLTVSGMVLDGTNATGTGAIIAKLYNGVTAY